MRSAMVASAGDASGRRPKAAEPVSQAASEANRIDALTKLKALFDSGVLTEEQYESERRRLTAGMR
jgi:hypothetical protein